MSKKWFIMLMAIAIGVFTAPGARADWGDFYFNQIQALPQNYGNTAGTTLNPEGRGDALIFPYYDVREIDGKTQDFYFAIINEQGECGDPTAECNAGVAIRINFHEWDKAENAFNLEIWLSRGEVWVGVVTHNQAIPLPYGARITSPDFVIVNFDVNTFTLAKPLANGSNLPTTALIPSGSSNLMGYLEVIGMERTFDHQSSGKVTRATWVTRDALNSLMGYAYIVRVADGQSFGYNAKAIANFSRSQGSLFFGPATVIPSLFSGEDYLAETEFQISKRGVSANYDIRDALLGKSSLILTFPTKQYHFCPRPNYSAIWSGGGTIPPGYCTLAASGQLPTQPWTAINASTPEPIDVTIFDQNENMAYCLVSPGCPPVGLPYAVNVIGLYKGTPPTLPATGNRDTLGLSTQTFDSGYITVGFPNTGSPQLLTKFLDFDTFFLGYGGLPVLGLSLQEYGNGNVGGFYGDIRDVFYKTEWNP